MPIRVCRDCGEEYRLDAPVSTCSDCGGPIEARDEAGAVPVKRASRDAGNDEADESGDRADGWPARICFDCGEEYRPDADVSECADCGGPIGTPAAARSSAAPVRSPDGPYRHLYGADRAVDLEPLAERLGGAGVPFQVRPGRFRFELWVPVAEADHARELLPEWFPPASDDPPDALPEAGPVRCPVCDAEVPAGTVDCPGCGLAVGAVEADECPRCGAIVAADAEACPECGRE